MTRLHGQHGFTLIEVVLVIVVAGILVGVAMRGSKQIADTARAEETKQELEALSTAIIGNSSLENSGSRPDFGYVGDVGSLPPNLDALVTNPGSYATWNGPYIQNRFSQTTDDYKRDAWNSLYTFTGGTTITSTGSGSNIVQNLASSTADLLINNISGLILDVDGTPPGTTYKDSLTVRLTYPNGIGGTATKVITPDAGGFFQIDSIPIGNQDIQIVYVPLSDTLRRFQSVTVNSSIYQEYRTRINFPIAGGSAGTSPHYAGAVGTNSWGTTSNAVGSGEGSCSSSGYGTSIVSGFWNSFGFSIPSGVTIQGIVVELRLSWLQDPELGLGITIGKGEATLGAEKVVPLNPAEFFACDATQPIMTLGSSNDLWGLTWTPADLNSTSFTVRLRRSVIGTETEVIVNWIRVSVYYN